jgi:hypothetical protein
MIEGSCVVDISGGINASPRWIRQYQARAEMKLATDHRSTTSMGPQQTGHRIWPVILGSVADHDGAGLEGHEGNLSYSLFVRLTSLLFIFNLYLELHIQGWGITRVSSPCGQ